MPCFFLLYISRRKRVRFLCFFLGCLLVYKTTIRLFTFSKMKVFLIILSVFIACSANAASLFAGKQFGSRSAVLVTDSQGKDIFSWNPNTLLIPASTIKIATGITAIEKFGLDYHFKTDFFFTEDTLWVKGYGDPFLTSEELDIVAKNLIHQLNIQFLRIKMIKVDGTHFPLLKVPGRFASSQPYDAPLAAVSANFNTINIRKKGNSITSAEPQTPITPLAKQLSKKLSNGVHRINLIKTDNSEQYFAELLAEKLKEHGLNQTLIPTTGFTPVDAQLIYQHVNSKKLSDAVYAMLFFSNNFIANQLFLQMRPSNEAISFAASAAYVKSELRTQLGNDQKTEIVEGSGLSRNNKLSARQLVALLKRFQPHKKLMKSYLGGKVFAKSGTLNGVQNLAGYISKNGKEYFFAFLFNESVPWRYRNTLLKELYATL